MSQGDCPRRQKNMDFEGLLESICREFIEIFKILWKTETSSFKRKVVRQISTYFWRI